MNCDPVAQTPAPGSGEALRGDEQCEEDQRDELAGLFAELADNLAAHSDIEEELFYPEVKQRQPAGPPWCSARWRSTSR